VGNFIHAVQTRNEVVFKVLQSIHYPVFVVLGGVWQSRDVRATFDRCRVWISQFVISLVQPGFHYYHNHIVSLDIGFHPVSTIATMIVVWVQLSVIELL